MEINSLPVELTVVWNGNFNIDNPAQNKGKELFQLVLGSGNLSNGPHPSLHLTKLPPSPCAVCCRLFLCTLQITNFFVLCDFFFPLRNTTLPPTCMTFPLFSSPLLPASPHIFFFCVCLPSLHLLPSPPVYFSRSDALQVNTPGKWALFAQRRCGNEQGEGEGETGCSFVSGKRLNKTKC